MKQNITRAQMEAANPGEIERLRTLWSITYLTFALSMLVGAFNLPWGVCGVIASLALFCWILTRILFLLSDIREMEARDGPG